MNIKFIGGKLDGKIFYALEDGYKTYTKLYNYVQEHFMDHNTIGYNIHPISKYDVLREEYVLVNSTDDTRVYELYSAWERGLTNQEKYGII